MRSGSIKQATRTSCGPHHKDSKEPSDWAFSTTKHSQVELLPEPHPIVTGKAVIEKQRLL